MTEALNQLNYEESTKTVEIECNLVGDNQIPGWSIDLAGWRISENMLGTIWAKIRKLLRVHGVDAVALFNAKETPMKMTIIPETSRVEENPKAFSEYMRKLAKVLNTKALAQFATCLVEAQKLSESDMSTAEIMTILFPPGFEQKLIDFSELTVLERITLRRKIRKVAKKDFKTAAKEAKEAALLAQSLERQAEESLRIAEAANGQKNAELLRQAATKDAELAASMKHRALEAQEKKIDSQSKYEMICQIFSDNNPIDGLIDLELTELVFSDSSSK